jgi:tripartite ATP-independent transporter DctM subunit
MNGGSLAALMFVTCFALVFLGYPVAFALGGSAVAFAALGAVLGVFDWPLMGLIPERIFGVMSNAILLAIPAFVAMGTLLEKSKLAEDLLTTIGAVFGRVRGGLALGVVIVGAVLAAATGVVGASVVAMSVISLPVMLRYGTSPRVASGVIAASGTLGQIIPPSVVLVVLADQLSVSVGDLFLGALGPGLMLVGLYLLWVIALAMFDPKAVPALPPEVVVEQRRGLLRKLLVGLAAPLILVVVVLGSLFAGIATPTEAGALGAVGAVVLAAVRRRLSWPVLRDAAEDTAKLTVMVVFLLVGSTAFALVFRGLGGDQLFERVLTGLPGGALGFLVVVNLVVFLLGFVLDFLEIAFIVLPLVVPIAAGLGIDLVWFGVVLGLNLQTSFLTPPFGFALFYLRGAAPPEVRTSDIYRGIVPFVAIQLLALAAVIAFPELVTR